MPGRHSSKAKFIHHRQRDPKEFVKGSLKTVPLSHSNYSGKKYDVPGAKAIVGKFKPAYRPRGKKDGTQSILTPKK